MPEIPFLIQLKKTLEMAYTNGISRVLDWEFEGKKITGRFLDGRELFNFSVSTDGITFKQTEIPKNDSWLAGYLAQAHGMQSMLVMDSADFWVSYFLQAEIRQDKARCGVGRGCGEGCISKDKQCQIDTPQVKRASFALIKRAGNEVDHLEKSYKLPDAKPATEGEISPAEKAIRAEEDKLRLNPSETAVAVDDDGKIVLYKKGEAQSVGFNRAEVDKLKGTTFTHNHPAAHYNVSGYEGDYRGAGFSPEDMRMACIAELKEIRAIAPEARFSMKAPPEGWSEDYWNRKMGPVYQKHMTQVYYESIDDVRSGRKTWQDANVDLPHTVAERTAKELGLKYKREPIEITKDDVEAIKKTNKTYQVEKNRAKLKRTLGEIAKVGALLAIYAAIVILEEESERRAQRNRSR